MQRSLLLSLGALSLISACSSGDGFSEDKGNNNGGGGGGATTEITSANAARVTRVSYRSSQAAGAAGGYSSGTGFITSNSGPAGRIDGSLGTSSKPTSANSGVPIPPTVDSCLEGGTTTLSGDIADPLTPTLTPGDYFDLTFQNCADGLAVIDGSLFYEVDAFSGDLLTAVYDLTMTATFTDFQVATDEDTQLSNGDVTVRLDTLDFPVITTDTSGDSLTVDGDLGSQTLSNFASSFTQDTDAVPSPYTQSGSGTLNTTLLSGTVSYSTPVEFQGFDADNPDSGEFLVSGENSSARLVVVDNVNINIELDSDGDGTVDETIEMTWAEFESL